MPRPPRPLEPMRSLHDLAGAELRQWRTLRGLSQHELGGLAHVSGALIGKFEKAERMCGPSLAAALDSVLDAGGAVVAAWYHAGRERVRPRDESDRIRSSRRLAATSRKSPGNAVRRRRPVSGELGHPENGHSAVAAGDIADLIGFDGPPESVSQDEVARIESVTSFFKTWDRSHGGAAMRGAVAAEVARALWLLSARCPPGLRHQLHAAVVNLGITCGAVLFDRHEYYLADRLFAFAAESGEQAGDWHLRAKALSLRARQETWRGNPDAGLTYAQLGLVRGDRLTATERAMLHTAAARALASLGREQDALRSIGLADDSFGAAAPAEDPPWMSYYDQAQHLGDTGHALFDLAVRGGHGAAAATRLAAAVSGHGDAFPRSRAFSSLKLAELTVRTGDPREAAEIARSALADLSTVDSRRLERVVADLIRATAPHARITEITDLTQMLRERTRAA